MNDIEELVKATAEAVTTLSKLVEGMPRIVDEKLATYQGQVAQAVASMTTQMEGIKAAQGELRGMVEATAASLQEGMRSARAESERIIADNQEASKSQFEALELRVDDAMKMIVTAENGLVKMLEGAKDETAAAAGVALRAVEEKLVANIAEVLKACDPTELRGMVQAIEQKLPTLIPKKIADVAETDALRDAVAALTERVELGEVKTHGRIADVTDKVAENLDNLEQQIKEVAESIPTIFDARSAGMCEQISELAATLGSLPTMDHLTAKAAELQGGIETVAQQVKEMAPMREELTAVTSIVGGLPTMEVVGQTIAVKSTELMLGISAVHEMVDGLEKRTTPIEAQLKDLTGSVAMLPTMDTVASIKVEQASVIGALDARLGDLEKSTDEKIAGVVSSDAEQVRSINEVADALRKFVASSAEFGASVEAKFLAVSQAIGDVENFAVEEDKKLELELRGHVYAVKSGAEAAAQQVSQKIVEVRTELIGAQEATVGSVAAMQAALATKADESLFALLKEDLDAVSTAHDALQKQVSALPEPVNATELEVRLTNKLADLIPEHASMELPAPEFDAYFEANQLMIRVKMGDKEVLASAEIPVGFVYRNTYDRNTKYTVGNFVTHKGSVWYARSTPTGEPGKDITGWQLAVKCGRDGKDATPTRAYDGHESGRVYRETDFLRVNNRLWQCAVKETATVPEPGDITSSKEWTLIGGVH